MQQHSRINTKYCMWGVASWSSKCNFYITCVLFWHFRSTLFIYLFFCLFSFVWKVKHTILLIMWMLIQDLYFFLFFIFDVCFLLSYFVLFWSFIFQNIQLDQEMAAMIFLFGNFYKLSFRIFFHRNTLRFPHLLLSTACSLCCFMLLLIFFFFSYHYILAPFIYIFFFF